MQTHTFTRVMDVDPLTHTHTHLNACTLHAAYFCAVYPPMQHTHTHVHTHHTHKYTHVHTPHSHVYTPHSHIHSHVHMHIILTDCLSSFTDLEELQEAEWYYCPRCKKKQPSTKCLSLHDLPNVHTCIFQCHNRLVCWGGCPNNLRCLGCFMSQR